MCCSEESFAILTKSLSKSRADLQKMRTFYKLDFDADMDEEVLRSVDISFQDQNIAI